VNHFLSASIAIFQKCISCRLLIGMALGPNLTHLLPTIKLPHHTMGLYAVDFIIQQQAQKQRLPFN